MKSKNECPFCGGRSWLWFYSHRDELVQEHGEGNCMIDLHVKGQMRGYTYGVMLIDECRRCGASLSTPDGLLYE